MNKEIRALREAGGEGLEAWVIILYDAQGETADANFCKGYRDTAGLDAMRVLFDPSLATAIYGDKETSIIIDSSGMILSEHHSGALEAIVSRLAEELQVHWAGSSGGAE